MLASPAAVAAVMALVNLHLGGIEELRRGQRGPHVDRSAAEAFAQQNQTETGDGRVQRDHALAIGHLRIGPHSSSLLTA